MSSNTALEARSFVPVSTNLVQGEGNHSVKMVMFRLQVPEPSLTTPAPPESLFESIVIVLGFICGFIISAVLVRFLLHHRRPTHRHVKPPRGSPIIPRPKMPDPDCLEPKTEQEEVSHQLPKRRRMSGEFFVEEEHISKRRRMSGDTLVEEQRMGHAI
ncbi:hypothetical protein MMC29_006743 [Sticta canariensis]|nr:hypothetical protein [Sticta canariensis]